MDELEEAVIAAAATLQDARLAYAKAFLMAKVSTGGMPVSDKTAEYTATDMTGDDRTVAQAAYEIALNRMRKEP